MDESEANLLKLLRESAAEALRFLSNNGREERERWVVSEFLKCQKVEFSELELRSPIRHSKVDIEFYDARFQIKEILNPGTMRYRDAKARYDHLMAATSCKDIIWPMFGYDVPPISTIYSLVAAEATALSATRNYAIEKADLDLIFYVTRSRDAQIEKE